MNYPCVCIYIYFFGQNTGLEKIWDAKPLVGGKEIMSVLQLKSGGPLVREWVRHSSLYMRN